MRFEIRNQLLAEAIQCLIDVNSEPLFGKFRVVFDFQNPADLADAGLNEALPFNQEGYAFCFPTIDSDEIDIQLTGAMIQDAISGL